MVRTLPCLWLYFLTSSACATGFGGSGDAGADAPLATTPDARVAPDGRPIADAGADADASPDSVDAGGTVDSGVNPASCQLAGELPEALGTFEVHTYAGSAGERDYWLYVPTGDAVGPRPLVVMIHACAQTAPQLAAATEYNRVAEAHGFLVAWPEQSLAANGARCWNWFLAAHQQRDAGEPAILAGIAAEIATQSSIDPQRIYVGGFSAGASMALVMAATYPDVFAAAASFAGCPYQGGCYGVESAETLADALLTAMGAQARRVPIFVANGALDSIVAPAANSVVVQQWLRVADILDDGDANQSVPATPFEVTNGAENGLSFERSLYADTASDAVAERWVMDGLGHEWCGGSGVEDYSSELGPSLSRETYRFFCENPLAIP